MHASRARIQFQARNREPVGMRGSFRHGFGYNVPSQNSPQPGKQFARIEGLGQVIVRTDLQADNPVHIFAPSSQQQHTHLRSSPQTPQNLKTVHSRKHHVQQHDGEPSALGALQARLPMVLRRDLESVAAQVVAEHRAKLPVVVDQEYRGHDDFLPEQAQLWLYTRQRART